MKARRLGFWWLQIPGWILLLYLVYAQAIPAFDYELGVRMGTQEPASRITEVGTAFWYGFAFADLVVYLPILFAGLIAHRSNWPSWRAVLGAALGITVYWPIVCLAAVADARDATGWNIDEASYWVVLPVIALWALAGLYVTATVPDAQPELTTASPRRHPAPRRQRRSVAE